MKYPSYCCQKCGRMIGWLGRFFEIFSHHHSCTPRFTVGITRQNVKLVYDTAWNLEEAAILYEELKTRLSIDPKTEKYDIWESE